MESWEEAEAALDLVSAPLAVDGGQEHEKGSWDEEPEEEFVPPRSSDDGDRNYDEPVLIVELSEAARQLGADDIDLSSLRDQLQQALYGSFISRSAELFGSGYCRHSTRERCNDERDALEEAKPDAVFTVIPYPFEAEGISIHALWAAVREPSGWEAVDEFKVLIADVSRDVRWKSEMCVELEALAAKEQEASFEQSMTEDDAMPFGDDAEEAVSERSPSVIDLLLDMLLRDLARPAATTLADHVHEVAERRDFLRRMWLMTFGRLPPASGLALKHMPRPDIQPVRSNGPSRMLVPLPRA